MTTVKCETLKGDRNVDVENKLVELADGTMTSYTHITPKFDTSEVTYAYMVTANAGVRLTQAGHKKANNIKEMTEEQKQTNLREQAIANVMSEGTGEY